MRSPNDASAKKHSGVKCYEQMATRKAAAICPMMNVSRLVEFVV